VDNIGEVKPQVSLVGKMVDEDAAKNFDDNPDYDAEKNNN
jgi:hypothetical protein